MSRILYAIGKTNKQAIELGRTNFSWLHNFYFSSIEQLGADMRYHFKTHSDDLDFSGAGDFTNKVWFIDRHFLIVPENAEAKDYQNIIVVHSVNLNSKSIGQRLSDCLLNAKI